MSAVDEIAAYLAYLKTEGKHIDQVIFDEMSNGKEMTATATDELCRLLDERGVEWETNETATGIKHIIWRLSESSWWDWYEDSSTGWLAGWQQCTAPEYAIEATLGRGECRNRARRPQTFWCDQCDCAVEGWVDVGGTLINGFRYCPNCGRKVRA